MSSKELRVRVVEFGRQFSSMVETAADEIARSTDDHQIRRNALRWKMTAIPAAQEAVLQVDPLMSLVDIWAFSIQMRNHFEIGAGSMDFGRYQSVALEAVARIERDVVDLASRVSVSGDLGEYQSQIHSWADNHPIDQSLILRDSVIGSGADLLGDQGGAFALVEDMNATAREMANRLAFYNEYLLKQVQWSGEMITSDVLASEMVDSLGREFVLALATSRQLLDDVPGLVQSERLSILEAVTHERESVLAAINLQRIETLEALRQERIATLAELSEERVIVLAAIRAEREVVLAALAEMLQDVPDQSKDVVDHAMWRLGQLMGLLLVGILVLALVILLVWRLAVGSGRQSLSSSNGSNR